MAAHLDLLNVLLAGRDYLVGDEPTAADFVAFPFVKYALMRDLEDTEVFHEILEEQQPLQDRHVDVASWIRRIDAFPRV
jgi:glutathione S-transferase